MIAPAHLAEYTQRYKQYFFQFEEDGEVLSIPGGHTICYTPFLFETLESLASRGAPPFGTLLLAIIATGSDATNMLAEAHAIIEKAGITDSTGKELYFLKTAFKFLETLSQLPPQYRQGARRLLVLQTIFLNAHNIIAERRIKVFISEYRSAGGLPTLLHPTTLTQGILTRDLRPLAQLHYTFHDVDALLAKLSDIPELADLPFETPAQITEHAAPKDFIEELEQHPDTFHAASLVRRIWSGLAIPFHSNHPSTQPLGGVADISNRGELDKLLLSEHANDEMHFLSRLANGEALYINRETPPETAKLQRILLIDSSLQAWGTPRTLAFALLLAIARHPKTDIDCIGFAVGGGCEAISFATIHEVISSLQLLDTGLNAATGLECFLNSALPKGRYEVLFLTSPAGIAQAPVQKILSEQGKAISYCITASEEGECSVYKKGSAGIRHLQSFTLPLEELWKSPPKEKAPPQEITTGPALPSEYPILFPAPRHFKKVLPTPGGQMIVITGERSVMQCAAEGGHYHLRGWRLLIDRLPAGDCIYETGANGSGEALLLCYRLSTRDLHLINLSTKARASLSLFSIGLPKGAPSFLASGDGFILLLSGASRNLTLIETQDATSVVMTEANLAAKTEQSLFFEHAARQENLTKFQRPAVSGGSVMKNLKRAFISDDGCLVINSRKLDISDGKTLRLSVYNGNVQVAHVAKFTDNISFPDQSTIAINPNGMLILTSSNPALPDIYIPPVLESSLAAATKDHFAGVKYYNPDTVLSYKDIQLQDFYSRYIQAFIDHIVQNAASAKAP